MSETITMLTWDQYMALRRKCETDAILSCPNRRAQLEATADTGRAMKRAVAMMEGV